MGKKNCSASDKGSGWNVGLNQFFEDSLQLFSIHWITGNWRYNKLILLWGYFLDTMFVPTLSYFRRNQSATNSAKLVPRISIKPSLNDNEIQQSLPESELVIKQSNYLSIKHLEAFVPYLRKVSGNQNIHGTLTCHEKSLMCCEKSWKVFKNVFNRIFCYNSDCLKFKAKLKVRC